MSNTAIVVGAGIVGLATARALALKGYHVRIIERSEWAVGASVRNFGMVWPIGQPSGIQFELAMRSKYIWQEIAEDAGIWYNETGSLHAAYSMDEKLVIEELYQIFKTEGRDVEYLNKEEIVKRFPSIRSNNLICALFSATETIVNPTKAIHQLAEYLNETLKVQFEMGRSVLHVENNIVFTSDKVFEADLIIICSGADFESLYPSIYATQPITKCKLQMMRFEHSSPDFNLGTSICGGLSLIHYDSFKAATSLLKLKSKYQEELPEYIANGIHVMVSQNELGQLTVGDSHHYGLTHDPFDSAEINTLILAYLEKFCNIKDWNMIQSWNGTYAKLTNGESNLFLQVEKNVYVFNGLGGCGMTLSFATAEKVIDTI